MICKDTPLTHVTAVGCNCSWPKAVATSQWQGGLTAAGWLQAGGLELLLELASKSHEWQDVAIAAVRTLAISVVDNPRNQDKVHAGAISSRGKVSSPHEADQQTPSLAIYPDPPLPGLLLAGGFGRCCQSLDRHPSH